MICTVMPEREFLLETGIEAKEWGSVHASEFQLSATELQMLHEDASGKKHFIKSSLNPPGQRKTLGESSSNDILCPFKKFPWLRQG